jgi:DNA-binding NarL/FixJ family response regulator
VPPPSSRYLLVKANPQESVGENVQAEPRLQVLSDSAAASRRIVGTLGEGGLSVAHVLSAPDEIDASSVDASTIFVFVCDVDEASGMAGLRRLRRTQGDPAIIVISPPATGTGVRRALDAGADAIVFEPEIETTLAVTTRAVASGQSVVPRKLRASVEKPAFSHRERQVLALVSRGLTNSEIAERLLLAQSTVKSHLSSAFTKLGIRSRKEVTALLLDPEQAQSVGLIGIGANGAAPEANGSTSGHNTAIPQPVA